jgi:hypothetical protein
MHPHTRADLCQIVTNPNSINAHPALMAAAWLDLCAQRGVKTRPENLHTPAHIIRATIPTVADQIEPHRQNAATRVRQLMADMAGQGTAARLCARMLPDGGV